MDFHALKYSHTKIEQQTYDEEWVSLITCHPESRGWWDRDGWAKVEWTSEGEQKCQTADRVCETDWPDVKVVSVWMYVWAGVKAPSQVAPQELILSRQRCRDGFLFCKPPFCKERKACRETISERLYKNHNLIIRLVAYAPMIQSLTRSIAGAPFTKGSLNKEELWILLYWPNDGGRARLLSTHCNARLNEKFQQPKPSSQ